MCSIITAFELHPVESRVISTSLVWLHLGSEAADRSSPRAYGSGPGTMESISVQICVRRPDPGEAMRHPVPSPGFVDGSLVLAVPEPESVGAGIVAMFVAPLWPKADPHNSPPFRHIFPASPRALHSLSRSEHLSVRALQPDRVDAGVVIVVVLGDERSFSLITFCLHLHSNHIFTFLTVAPPPPSAPVGCYIWLQNWNWIKDIIDKYTCIRCVADKSVKSRAIIRCLHNLNFFFTGIPQGPLETSPGTIKKFQKRFQGPPARGFWIF